MRPVYVTILATNSKYAIQPGVNCPAESGSCIEISFQIHGTVS